MSAFAADLSWRFRVWVCHLLGHDYETHSGWVRCQRCDQVWNR